MRAEISRIMRAEISRITWRGLVGILGVTFNAVTWCLLILSIFIGDDRSFYRATAPVFFLSLIGGPICGILIIKRKSALGWGLVCSAIAALIFAILTPEL